MDATANIFPARYVINRSLRVPQFIRALAMTVIGLLLMLPTRVPQLELFTSFVCIGIVLAFSGGCALLGLCVVTLAQKEHVIEVNTQGLQVTYANGYTE